MNKIIKKLGSGSGGDAFLLNNGKAIVVGKREDSFSLYKSLHEKLKRVEGEITTIKYPKIYELVEPCETFPFGAVVEERIEGSELRKKITDLSVEEKTEIGEILAKFLNQLHGIIAEGNKEEEIKINLAKYDRSIGILKGYLNEGAVKKLESRVKEDYKKLIESKEFCLTHGDLNAGNIMIGNDNKLSGIIDFGNMEYYIPEIEFIHMYFFDKTIYDSMVNSYDKEIKEKDMILLELVVNIRHFKNIVNFDEKREHCLNNICKLLEQYLSFVEIKAFTI